MRGYQDYLERGYSDGAICADCGCGTSQLDERDRCRGCAESAAHDESAPPIYSARSGYKPLSATMVVKLAAFLGDGDAPAGWVAPAGVSL